MREKSKFPKKVISIRINEKQIAKLDKIAESREEERSELVRKIIELYIKTHEL